MVFLCFLLFFFRFFSRFVYINVYIAISYIYFHENNRTVYDCNKRRKLWKENQRTWNDDANRASQYKWFRIESMWLAIVALVNAKAVVRSIAIHSLLHITWLYIISYSSMVYATNVDTRHEYKAMNIHDNTLKHSNNNKAKTVREPWQSHKIPKQWKKLW